MSDNTIAVDDNLLSKSQCKIEYKENISKFFILYIIFKIFKKILKEGWILTDGKDKPSTNGTWLYLGEQQTIYNGMIFKANQTVFQVNL